jgi:hypothetical protein
LPLVTWLFAVPHLAIVSLLTGGGRPDRDTGGWVSLFGLVFAVGVILLFTVRCPRGLFDLAVGIKRRIPAPVRVATGALAALPVIVIHPR